MKRGSRGRGRGLDRVGLGRFSLLGCVGAVLRASFLRHTNTRRMV